MVGFLIFIFGVYLIFAEQVFFGVLSIILAFLIFPNRSSSGHYYSSDNDYSNEHAYSLDSDSGGGDSGGSGD